MPPDEPAPEKGPFPCPICGSVDMSEDGTDPCIVCFDDNLDDEGFEIDPNFGDRGHVSPARWSPASSPSKETPMAARADRPICADCGTGVAVLLWTGGDSAEVALCMECRNVRCGVSDEP